MQNAHGYIYIYNFTYTLLHAMFLEFGMGLETLFEGTASKQVRLGIVVWFRAG